MSLKTMPGWVGGGGPGQGWGWGGVDLVPRGHPVPPPPPLTLQAHDAADDHDVAPAAPLHVGQHLLDQADEAEEVGVHEALHGRQALAFQGTRHAHPGVADCGGTGRSAGRPLCWGDSHAQRVHGGSPARRGSLVQGGVPSTGGPQHTEGPWCRMSLAWGGSPVHGVRGPWCSACPCHRGSPSAWTVPAARGVTGSEGPQCMGAGGPWCTGCP